MGKFKVGDRVKCNIEGITKGKTGVVVEIRPNGSQGKLYGADRLINEIDMDNAPDRSWKLFLFDEELDKES